MAAAASYEPKEFPPVKGLHVRALNDERIAERIRVIDRACLPVRYSDTYYDTYVKRGLHQYNQLAYFNDILVGSITCRIERNEDEGVARLYIMTICVLEPYRKLGIGSRLLQRILDNVRKETVNKFSCVALHAQTGSSVEAFYRKFNFGVVEEVRDYYNDLEVKDALLMTLVVPQPHFAQGGHSKKSGK